jgi:hypothetical protein
MRERAQRAAAFGLVRGDLWSDDALAHAATVINDIANHKGIGLNAAPRHAEYAAKQAVALTPFDSRAWLVLASLTLDHGDPTEATRALKMAYLTGPNLRELIAFRMLVATRGTISNEPEIQTLARADFRNILIHRPDLQPAILSAYKTASTPGQRFILETVGDLDPGFAKTLTANP